MTNQHPRTIRHIGPGTMDLAFYQRLSTFVRHQSAVLEPWTPELLGRCQITLVTESDQYVAVAWFHDASALLPGALMVHGAAAEKYRGRWVSLRTMGEILGSAFDTGATRLYAHCPSEFIANFWQRLGFHLEYHETEGLLAYKDRDEWLTK